MSQTLVHQPLSAIHVDERKSETLRWPGQWSKMLFHPRAEAPRSPTPGWCVTTPALIIRSTSTTSRRSGTSSSSTRGRRPEDDPFTTAGST